MGAHTPADERSPCLATCGPLGGPEMSLPLENSLRLLWSDEQLPVGRRDNFRKISDSYLVCHTFVAPTLLNK